LRTDGAKTAVLGTVETSARMRIAIVRFKDADRGWTEMVLERLDRTGEWQATGARIAIPNAAIFLVADAMARSCQLARDKR
jgi:hypothetical protein